MENISKEDKLWNFWDNLFSGKKQDCPCCGRYAQMYRRKLHYTAVKKLISLYSLGGEDQYVHTSRLVVKGDTSIGDFSKAKYWGLIEEAISSSEMKKTSGLWKLTPKGVLFVKNKIQIPRTAFIFNDTFFGFSDDLVSISECLMGGGFDYSEIMGSVNEKR